MPKGSKKRRAEKRKKEKEAHHNDATSPSNSAQGSEDLKSQSDSGEVSFSSVATTNNKNSSTSSTSDERESGLGHGVVGSERSEVVGSERKKKKEEEDVVEITRDLKVQEEGGRGDSVKETTSSDSGSGSGSGSGSDSGSSSDDESEAVEKKKKKKDDFDLVTETKIHEDLIEKVVSISEDVEIVEFTPAAEKTGDSGVIDLPSKEVVQVVVGGGGGGDVSSCESSNGYENNKEVTITETSNNKLGTTAPSGGGYEHEFEATSPEIVDKQRLSVTPLSSENSNGSKHRDEAAATTEISNNQKQQAESVPLSSEVSGRHDNRSETTTPEIKDKKEQIALARPTVQPTSWKSCCGLFDVFMGSNR